MSLINSTNELSKNDINDYVSLLYGYLEQDSTSAFKSLGIKRVFTHSDFSNRLNILGRLTPAELNAIQQQLLKNEGYYSFDSLKLPLYILRGKGESKESFRIRAQESTKILQGLNADFSLLVKAWYDFTINLETWNPIKRIDPISLDQYDFYEVENYFGIPNTIPNRNRLLAQAEKLNILKVLESTPSFVECVVRDKRESINNFKIRISKAQNAYQKTKVEEQLIHLAKIQTAQDHSVQLAKKKLKAAQRAFGESHLETKKAQKIYRTKLTKTNNAIKKELRTTLENHDVMSL